MTEPDRYCAAPFHHMALNCGKRRWRPCCAWSHKVDFPLPDDYPEPLSHPLMEDLRRHMLTGQPHDGCASCYRDEAAVGHSMRLQFNIDNGRMLAPKLTYLEMNFGNLCNFKCRMCNSSASSRWIADEVAMGQPRRDVVRRRSADFEIDVQNLDRIKFIGGEPSLEQDQMRHMLDRIHALRGTLSHLEVEIITNGYVRFDDDLLAKLASCRCVMMQVSIDGIEAENDYQRVGSQWHTVIGNARYYHAMTSDRWQVFIATSVGIFNIGGIMTFIQWLAHELPLAKQILQLIDWPIEQRISNLPEAYKRVILERLDAWQPTSQVAPSWLPYGHNDPTTAIAMMRYSLMQPPSVSIDAVRAHVDLLDGLNGQSLRDHIPELHAVLYG